MSRRERGGANACRRTCPGSLCACRPSCCEHRRQRCDKTALLSCPNAANAAGPPLLRIQVVKERGAERGEGQKLQWAETECSKGEKLYLSKWQRLLKLWQKRARSSAQLQRCAWLLFDAFMPWLCFVFFLIHGSLDGHMSKTFVA